MSIYLDEQGDPVTAPPVYLDESGTPHHKYLDDSGMPHPSIAQAAAARLAARGTSAAQVKANAAAGKPVAPETPSMYERVAADTAAVVGGTGELLGNVVAGVPEQLTNIVTAVPRVLGAAAGTLVGGGSVSDAWKAARDVHPHRELENLVSAASTDAQAKIRKTLGVRPQAIVPQEELMKEVPAAMAIAAGIKAEAGKLGGGEAVPEATADVPLSDAQIDRLKTDTQLGNGMRNVPAKLAQAINEGTVGTDATSIRGFLAKNPDAVREVQQGYALPGSEPLVANAAHPIPSPGQIAGVAKKFGPVKEFMDAVAPASASPEAASAADILRRSKSEISNDATIERVRNKLTAKAFSKAGDDANIANISAYEKTGQFADAPSGYSEMYRETTDAAHQTLKEVYGDDRVGYVDNYVRRAFKFGTEEDANKATGVLSNWIGSLSASQSPLKGRVLSVPLDEALQTMKAAGIDVKPATTNPELLRQWTVENANQVRVYKQAWDDAKSGDLIQFVKQGGGVPRNLIPLDDKVAKVFRPTDEGMVQTGRYFAEPGVARIFNNAISTGLGGSPTFRAIRTMNNAYNQMQLGLSAFHLTGTAINAGLSDLSLGVQQILSGEVAAGAKSLGRSASFGTYSFARDLYKGRNFINDLVADDPAAKAVLEEKLNPAGGRLGVDQAYRNTAYDNMVKAWSNRRFIRAAGNAPLAVVQKIASPLMEYAIPRVKIGAFMDLADSMRQKLGPDATPTEIQRAYEGAWDSIDNRFGQLVHDNLFWSRTAADLAQVSTRSVGWNLGTVREIGGGATDALSGKLTQRTLYSLGLPIYAGMIGAAYMYLHTGKIPETMRDYFYPQNGLKDQRGRNDRVALPTYMKDVYAYSDHPITTLEHKASPILSMAFDLGTNKDYFGDMIRNPDDTAAKQWQQVGAYALKQAMPFSIQQMHDMRKHGAKPAQAAEQFMGFVEAPAAMRMSPAQEEAAKRARKFRNDATMTKQQARHQ